MSTEQPIRPKHWKPCDLPSTQSTASFWHTEPSSLLTAHRSTRHLPRTADVVIIGSGLTGASVAHHLLNSGIDDEDKIDVVLLEAREACWGATGRNGGHCQPDVCEHPNDPSIGRFEIRNFNEIHHLVRERNVDCEFVAQTGVRAFYTRRHLKAAELDRRTLEDIAPDLAHTMRITTNKDELNSFHTPKALGAIVNTVAARLWPYKLVARILEDLITSTSLPGTFNLQTLTPATKIEYDRASATVSVETDRGSIRAKKVILATNGYTSHLLPTFADLIVPCRGQMSSLIPFPSVAGADRLKTSLGFAGDNLDGYLIQRPDESGGHLMFGGGGKRGHLMGVTDDSTVDEQTSHYLRGTLVKTLSLPEGGERRSFDRVPCDFCSSRNVKCLRPAASSEHKPCQNCEAFNEPSCSSQTSSSPREMDATHIWTGIMGYSKDKKPWVGEMPDSPGVYVAAGYTGHGMPQTWLCGKFVALLARSALAGKDDREALDEAVKGTGLPETFRITRERIKKALAMEDVEVTSARR